MAFDRMYNPYAQKARIGQNGMEPALANPGMNNGMNGMNNGMANGMNNGNGRMAFRQDFRGRGLSRFDEDCLNVDICKPKGEIELCPVVDVCPPAGPVCITVEKRKCVDPCEVELIRLRPDCPMLVEDYWVSKSVKSFEIVDARIGCISLTTGDNISGRDLLRDSDDDDHHHRRRHRRNHCNIIRGIQISQQHPLVLKVLNKNDHDAEEFKIKLFGSILAGW